MDRQPAHAMSAPIDPLGISRRRLFAQAGAWSAAAGLGLIAPGRVAAQEMAPPVAGDASALLALSQTLCGGGELDPARAEMLLQLLSDDPELSTGLAELQAEPFDDLSALSPEANAAAAAILLFWYAGAFNGEPVSDRATAYYSLTAWQAMYTYPMSTCRGFGLWQDPPPDAPMKPANS
jgi:hypothetical protein